jgi:hypothetical protein
MTEEEWQRHINCDTAKRDHKWHWKLDIQSGLPSLSEAVCVHCGRHATVRNGEFHVQPQATAVGASVPETAKENPG